MAEPGVLRLNYSYNDAPTLEDFSLSDAFIRGIVGPIGSGKSSACALEIVNRGREQVPGPDGIARSRWAVVRNTMPELRNTTIKTFMQWFPAPYFGRYYVTDHRYLIKAFDKCEIEVMFIALDRPEDARKLLSLELTGAWVNEAREIPWSIIEDLQGRLGRYPAAVDGGASWYGLWLDTNPPDVDSKWYKFFEEQTWLASFHEQLRNGELPRGTRPEDYVRIFRQPGGMAPNAENIRNLPGHRRYYTTVKVGKGKDWISVYVDAEYGFVMDGKAVFPEYNDRVHCHEFDVDFDDVKTVYRGWDFGLCYSDDTEVLTFDGWKLFKDVDTDRDMIATRNPETGAMEYAKAAFKIEKDYEGDMLEWSSTELNICVTPEHRVPFTYRDSPKKVHWQSAEWLADHMGGHHYVDLTSTWETPISLPALIQGMEPMVFAEFMGIYLAEGSTSKNRIQVYQKHRNQEIQRILEATGLPWKWRGEGKAAGWRVTDQSLAAFLKTFGTAKTKRAPRDVRFLPPQHIRAFISAYTIGDGHIRKRANGSVEHTLFTTSRGMADDMQDLAQKAGWNSSVRVVKPQRSRMEGRIIQGTGGYSICFKKTSTRAELLKANFRRVSYNGKIYCLNVPHHTLYVRRGGKPSWNGNTPACTFSYVTTSGQWRTFDEMTTDRMGIERFADDVLLKCGRNFPKGAKFRDIGDPAGNADKETDERSVFDIMRAKGIDIDGGDQSLSLRLESVRRPMTMLANGEPMFLLHPRCKVLRKGYKGAYCYKRIAGTADRFRDVPNKDQFSHPQDANQYVATHLFGAILRGQIPEDDDIPEPEYGSDRGRSAVTGY